MTFTELLVTSAPFFLQDAFLSDRPKLTHSFLGHDNLNLQFIFDASENVLLPSTTSYTVLFYVFGVYCVGYCIEARGGTVG
jgi:hypothetical protein